jgi:scyllo-inositol 2-dehydrogenase (NADP+)
MTNRIIKTALASYGMSGSVFHAPFIHIHPGFELTKILERHRSDSKEKYPYSTIVRNFNDIIDDPEIELVIVNTPDHLHFQMVKEALLAGKHVIVEKPFTQSSVQAEELIEIAKRHKKILSVYHNRRFDGDSLTVQQILKNGSLGRIVEYEAHYDRYRNYIPSGWKENPDTGASIVYNLGSHLVDHCLFLFGKPLEVWAKIDKIRDGALTDDFFEIKLIYPNMLASLKASYLVKEAGPRYMLHGTNGSFIKSGSDPQEEDLKKGVLPIGSDWGKEAPFNWGILNISIGENEERKQIQTIPGNYMGYYDNIYNALTIGETLIVKAEQGLEVIRIIEAAYKSSAEKRNILYE